MSGIKHDEACCRKIINEIINDDVNYFVITAFPQMFTSVIPQQIDNDYSL